MQSDGKGAKPLARRSFLNSVALGAGLAGIGTPRSILASSAQEPTAHATSYFSSLATLRDRARRPEEFN